MSTLGSQEYYNNCYQQYASWGVDSVKVIVTKAAAAYKKEAKNM